MEERTHLEAFGIVTGLPNVSSSASLMAKIIKRNPDLYFGLSEKYTKRGWTLDDHIQFGIDHPNDNTGICALERDSYGCFRLFFEKIREICSFRATFGSDESMMDFDIGHMRWLHVIESVEVIVHRNLKGYPFPRRSSRVDRYHVYAHVTSAILKVQEGDVEWADLQRIPVSSVKPVDSRDWPQYRAAYATSNGLTTVFVNYDDHIEIRSKAPGCSIDSARGTVYRLLLAVEKGLENSTPIAQKIIFDPDFGYLTTDPTLCGSGLVVSAQLWVTYTITMPGASSEDYRSLISSICDYFRMSLCHSNERGNGVERRGEVALGGTWITLLTRHTAGLSEEDILHTFYRAVRVIARLEDCVRHEDPELVRAFIRSISTEISANLSRVDEPEVSDAWRQLDPPAYARSGLVDSILGQYKVRQSGEGKEEAEAVSESDRDEVNEAWLRLADDDEEGRIYDGYGSWDNEDTVEGADSERIKRTLLPAWLRRFGRRVRHKIQRALPWSSASCISSKAAAAAVVDTDIFEHDEVEAGAADEKKRAEFPSKLSPAAAQTDIVRAVSPRSVSALVLRDYPNLTNEHTSLMAQVLSPGLYKHLLRKRTRLGFSVARAIRPGIEGPGLVIGIVAGDEDTYDVFRDIFTPIARRLQIQELTRHKKVTGTKMATTSVIAMSQLECDRLSKSFGPAVESRIRMSRHTIEADLAYAKLGGVEAIDLSRVLQAQSCLVRNIKGYPLGPAITRAQRRQVLYAVKMACLHGVNNSDELLGPHNPISECGPFHTLSQALSCRARSGGGSFFSIDGVPERLRGVLSAVGLQLTRPLDDSELGLSECARDWPDGRAVFVTPEADIIVAINQSDHCRIITTDANGDVSMAFRKASLTCNLIDEYLRQNADRLSKVLVPFLNAPSCQVPRNTQAAKVPSISSSLSVFQRSLRFGNVSVSAENSGAGFRALAKVLLQALGSDAYILQEICCKMGLTAELCESSDHTDDGVDGDNGAGGMIVDLGCRARDAECKVDVAYIRPLGGTRGGERAHTPPPRVFIVSMAFALGRSEVQLAQGLIDGLAALVEMDRQLADGIKRADEFVQLPYAPPLPPPPTCCLPRPSSDI